MEVVDDDFFVVIIGDEDKQKQKSKHQKSKQLQSTRNNTNTKEIKYEKANFTSALNLIDNAKQHGEVTEIKTEPVETLEEGECLSIKSELEDTLEEDEFNLQTDEKFESSTDDNLLVPILTTNKRKRVVKPIERKNIMVEIPTEKKKRKRLLLKPEERRSYIEELRQQFAELKEDEDLLVETLRGVLGELKAPPPPKEYYIMNDTMYECLFCEVNTCTARLAELHYQEQHGPIYWFCFACGVKYKRLQNLYGHEKACKAKDAPILLKARDLLLKRRKACIPESEPNINTEEEELPKSEPVLEEDTPSINTEEEELPKSEPVLEEDIPSINTEEEVLLKSEPVLEEDNPSINTEEEEFPKSEPAFEEVDIDEEFLNSDLEEQQKQTLNMTEEESESDNKITIEVPKYKKIQVRRAHVKPQSYIKKLREEYPELRADKELLIETLSGIMRNMKPPPPPPDYFIMNGVMFECVFCGLETNTMGAAARHFQHKHGTRYLVCFSCGSDYVSTTDLYKHEKRCRAPDAIIMLKARARALGPKGRSRPYLTEHKYRMSSSHVKRVRRRYIKSPDRARYRCDLCSADFGSNAALQSHLHLHSGVRPYQCRHCPSAYTSKIALNHHTAKHTDVEFICDHCKRSFKLKKSLVVHMAIHYPVRNNTCEYCGRSYTQKMSLTQHVSRKHLKLSPPFLCHICDKRYWKNSTLKEHMKREHESILVTRNMFIKKLPKLTEAELIEAKLIHDSDFTNVNDTVLIPEGGVVVKPPPEKKKRVRRKRKAEVNVEKKKKAKKGEIKKPESDDNPKAIIKNLKDIVVKKIKKKKQKKSNERDVIKYFAIQPMDDVVTLNEGFKRKYKTNDTPKKIYFSNIHKTKPRTETTDVKS